MKREKGDIYLRLQSQGPMKDLRTWMLCYNAFSKGFRKLKNANAISILVACRGSLAWESTRLKRLFEGEAEDRVIAGSNLALGTMRP